MSGGIDGWCEGQRWIIPPDCSIFTGRVRAERVIEALTMRRSWAAVTRSFADAVALGVPVAFTPLQLFEHPAALDLQQEDERLAPDTNEETN